VIESALIAGGIMRRPKTEGVQEAEQEPEPEDDDPNDQPEA
jgi:hypothetical protein